MSQDLYEVSPRYLAASPPSDHRDHLNALAENTGWTLHTDGPTAVVTSPCERIVVRHDQAAESFGPHLVITARTGPGAPVRWRADIAGNTPVEILTTLTTTITTALETDPDHLVYDIAAVPEQPITLLADAGDWEFVHGPGVAGMRSTDGYAAALQHAPDDPAPPLRDDPTIAWHLFATHPAGSLWAVSFTHDTPLFVVASALEQTLSPEPLIRPAGLARHPAFAPLITTRPVPAKPAQTTTGLPPQPPGPAQGSAKAR
ncbi:DUF317 domain-containing protein [Streptomyces sp. NPDC020875]|uniref:DUF317 domain-containing protein n=1 Tax=Streptomyces sp. NPDC020875 TaxID=3154898 RepID=UPI0033DAD718